MSEDSETTFKEARLPAVPLDILIIEERDDCLRNRQTSCHKACPYSGYRLLPFIRLTPTPYDIAIRMIIFSPEAAADPGCPTPNESTRVCRVFGDRQCTRGPSEKIQVVNIIPRPSNHSVIAAVYQDHVAVSSFHRTLVGILV